MAQPLTENSLRLAEQLRILRLRAARAAKEAQEKERRLTGRAEEEWNTASTARLIHVTRATYCRYESGEILIPPLSLERLLDAWGHLISAEEREMLMELRVQAGSDVWSSEHKLPDKMRKLASFEALAKTIHVFELAAVYGPLQTDAYAGAIIRGTNPPGTKEDQNRLETNLRIERKERIFMVKKPPTLRVVFDEGVLRRNVGGPSVMREQLAFLASLEGPCELRILPFSAPATPALSGAFWIFDFRDDVPKEPAAYVEAQWISVYAEKKVDRARLAFEALWEVSLNPVASRELILSVMEELEG